MTRMTTTQTRRAVAIERTAPTGGPVFDFTLPLGGHWDWVPERRRLVTSLLARLNLVGGERRDLVDASLTWQALVDGVHLRFGHHLAIEEGQRAVVRFYPHEQREEWKSSVVCSLYTRTP